MYISDLKILVPHSLRKFLRDFDSAYQERLQEIAIKNQQIAVLENNNKKLSHELKLSYELKLKEREAQELKNLTISDEDYEHLSKIGIFIVGCARSGTSILCDCLNQSTEVLLLAEANFYVNHEINNFVDFFNSKHVKYDNCRFKGTFIPPARLPDRNGFDILLRMNKYYKFVGEKVAFGPYDVKYGNEYFQEIFFNFHAKYFYFSKYILIMRRPTEVIWSMVKNFPERSIKSIFECWLRSIRVQIDIFQTFPNAYLLFFENLNLDTILNLCSIMGIDISISQNLIRDEYKHSLLTENKIPEPLVKYSKICLKCEEVYQQIRNEINPDKYKLNDTAANFGIAKFGFSYCIQKKLDEIIYLLSTIES